MRNYNYKNEYKALLTPEVVHLMTSIHEYRGRQVLFENSKKVELGRMLEIAKIQSVDASNRIEGVYTTDDRLRKLVLNKTIPRNRSEREIAGYTEVLSMIHDSFEHIPVKHTSILQMHRNLFKYDATVNGGKFKVNDNGIVLRDINGNVSLKFLPVKAWETENHVCDICSAFSEIEKLREYDLLLVIPLFIFDFLCIHPFSDGNGRMSRLLTLLLLYKSGYSVGKYISIENIINKNKESYYEVLEECSCGWYENQNIYLPFVKYMLETICAAYEELYGRLSLIIEDSSSKPNKIRAFIKGKIGKITKAEIMEKCPDVSHITVQRTLKELQEKGEITKIGGGRYTSYVWNHEKN